MFQSSHVMTCSSKPPLPSRNPGASARPTSRCLNKSISPVRDLSTPPPTVLKTNQLFGTVIYNKDSHVVAPATKGTNSVAAPVEGQYVPKKKWIINEEQAVVSSSSSRGTSKNTTLVRAKETKKQQQHLSITNMVVNFKDFKNTSVSIESLNTTQIVEKSTKSPFAVTRTQESSASLFTRAESMSSISISGNEAAKFNTKENNSESGGEHLEDDSRQFKSVRERIEYFSGRLSRERSATTANLSQSLGRESPGGGGGVYQSPQQAYNANTSELSSVRFARSASHNLNTSFKSSLINVARVLEKRKGSMHHLDESGGNSESFIRFPPPPRPTSSTMCKSDLCQI